MHIFISYAKVDTYDLATNLRDELSKLDAVTAWMDETLIPGESWAARIQSEIRRCDVVVVLLSPDVNREPDGERAHSFVINEIEYAQRHRKPIIPVLAQLADVPIQIATLQYIDLTHDRSIGLKHLSREIARRAGVAVPVPPVELTPLMPDVLLQDGLPSKVHRGLNLRILTALGAVIVVLLLAGYALLNRPPVTVTNSPTSTQQVALAPVSSPTDTPSPTPTATHTPTPTVTPLPLGFTPITRNTDWTPVSQTFGGVEMVLVPVGCFLMGDDENDDEYPVTRQCIQKPFWIDKTEVTNNQYGSGGNFEGGSHPRETVTWFQARDFCAKRGARLPTESEWEYSARGPSDFVYPWGNNFIADNVVYETNSNSQTSNVGSHHGGDSWVGASDLSGNVWEWVSSIYLPYPYRAFDGREVDSNNINVLRTLRGGSWYGSHTYVRSTYRYNLAPSAQFFNVGFRCANAYKL